MHAPHHTQGRGSREQQARRDRDRQVGSRLPGRVCQGALRALKESATGKFPGKNGTLLGFSAGYGVHHSNYGRAAQ
jgi:hypothetical protein